MLIQILSIQPTPATTKTGKPYEVLDIAFKNLTFQGKVEGKKLMPFGPNAAAFNTLKSATSGQTFEITVVKNEAGYNDWTQATQSDGSAPAATSAPAGKSYSAPPAANNGRGFPTPEERAQTQVYIVRQSSLSNAIASLAVGGKSALKVDDVVATARLFEAYVLGVGEAPAPEGSGFEGVFDSDVPL